MDTARLHRTFIEAEPFPKVVIESFLEPDAACGVANAYPAIERRAANGQAQRAIVGQLKLCGAACAGWRHGLIGRH